MSIDQVKKNITSGPLATYNKDLPSCADFKNLGLLTRTLIVKLLREAFPGE